VTFFSQKSFVWVVKWWKICLKQIADVGGGCFTPSQIADVGGGCFTPSQIASSRERMALGDPISSPNSSHGMNPLTIVTKFGYSVTKCSQTFPMKWILCDCCTQNLRLFWCNLVPKCCQIPPVKWICWPYYTQPLRVYFVTISDKVSPNSSLNIECGVTITHRAWGLFFMQISDTICYPIPPSKWNWQQSLDTKIEGYFLGKN
jgi:hypothetical protein